MNLHIPKRTPILGVGVSNGLPNLQRAMEGVKNIALKCSLYHWKNLGT
jgi:hypothetical protein